MQSLQSLHANVINSISTQFSYTYTERRRPQPRFTHSPKRHKHLDGGLPWPGTHGDNKAEGEEEERT